MNTVEEKRKLKAFLRRVHRLEGAFAVLDVEINTDATRMTALLLRQVRLKLIEQTE